jgi:DNA-3-methyladenine glycosylase II
MRSYPIIPDGPFSLAAAAAFGFGPDAGRPKPAGGEMRLAFVTDDMRHHAAVHLVQRADGPVTAAVESDADHDAVLGQVRRILSLDRPGGPWAALGERDPVIGALQRQHDWLRPVLFHSPYEAAAWSIISARRYRAQATAVRTRICAELGATPTVAGTQVPAFPLPERLLSAESLPGMAANRVTWLRVVAQAALDGELDAPRLAAMAPGDALTALQQLPGIGPMYATLILLRATGVADAMTATEPRLPGYVAHFYGTGPQPASREEIERIAEGWRPYRTWAAVLIRAAGDRLGLAQAALSAVRGQALGDAVVEALAGEDGADVLGDPGERVRQLRLDLGDDRLGGAPLGRQQAGDALGLGREHHPLAARVGGLGGLQPAGRAHRRDLLAKGRVRPADRTGQLGDRHRAADVQPDDLEHPARLEVIDAVVGIDLGDLVVQVGQQPGDRPPPAALGRVVRPSGRIRGRGGGPPRGLVVHAGHHK